jgi:plasmid stabilization system protein ParE
MTMGRARPELRPGYRSAVFGNYVIFLRYVDENGHLRAVLQVIHILYGARDLDAYFKDPPGSREH